jgi:hypothetical protein
MNNPGRTGEHLAYSFASNADAPSMDYSQGYQTLSMSFLKVGFNSSFRVSRRERVKI